MNNANDKLMEHLAKDSLKQAIDNNYNFTDQQKHELKSIVDAGRTPDDVIKGILAYFAFKH